MSVQYDEYLDKHKTNVEDAFQWFLHNLPDLIPNIEGVDWFWQMRVAHDLSKNTIDEYAAYDNYFYGNNQSYAVLQAFNYAWLSHINSYYSAFDNINQRGRAQFLHCPYCSITTVCSGMVRKSVTNNQEGE